MDLDLSGNTALVSASSSGLGKASATALAREGADVVLNGRDVDRLHRAVSEVRDAAAGRVVPAPGDITDPAVPAELVQRAVDEFGGLDHLVTSAGGPPSGWLRDTTDAEWYAAFDLLVMSVVRLVREAATPLTEAGGSVVTITSKTVKEAVDALVLSNGVRMAVIGLEKTLSRELAPAVRVNAVLPASIESPRVRNLLQDAVDRGDYESYEAARDARVAGVPLDRLGRPIELGDTVAFLCSERAAYITGAAIPIDGGATRSNL